MGEDLFENLPMGIVGGSDHQRVAETSAEQRGGIVEKNGVIFGVVENLPLRPFVRVRNCSDDGAGNECEVAQMFAPHGAGANQSVAKRLLSQAVAPEPFARRT